MTRGTERGYLIIAFHLPPIWLEQCGARPYSAGGARYGVLGRTAALEARVQRFNVLWPQATAAADDMSPHRDPVFGGVGEDLWRAYAIEIEAQVFKAAGIGIDRSQPRPLSR